MTYEKKFDALSTEEKIALIEAEGEGKVVLVKTISDGWVQKLTPDWHGNLRYRVKPEPRVIEFWVNYYGHNPNPYITLGPVYTNEDEARAEALPGAVTLHIRKEIEE